MNYDAQAAVADWNREVDAEMARLIRSGTPPFQAAGEAQRIVSDRRRYARKFTDTDKQQAIEALRQAGAL